MKAITSNDASAGLCATRRSAGVPFFIQAIVATEDACSGRTSFHHVMTQLLTLAVETKGNLTDAQVWLNYMHLSSSCS